MKKIDEMLRRFDWINEKSKRWKINPWAVPVVSIDILIVGMYLLGAIYYLIMNIIFK